MHQGVPIFDSDFVCYKHSCCGCLVFGDITIETEATYDSETDSDW